MIGRYKAAMIPATPDKETLLDEELLLVRNSGEIPEIAFHSALHYLAADPDGPGLTLSAADIRLLEKQVVARYREILLRDLDPANRDLRLYRGIKRCIFNWGRLGKFCGRQGLACDEALRREIGAALCAFLHNEALEVREGLRASSVNCTAQELTTLCEALAVEAHHLPAGWQKLCL
ncbi:MAG: hypothetical protein AB1413_06720 [Thermodesulfobacteriota bacterium]